MVGRDLIVAGKRVALPESVAAVVPSVATWVDSPLIPHLSNGKRTKPLSLVVLHETCGFSSKAAMQTLKKRALGIHLVLGPAGDLSQCADLATEICWHASQANATSIGIEIVNPYTTTTAVPPFDRRIPAEWWTWCPRGAERLYTTPTRRQMAALAALVPWLCGVLGVPYEFPTRALCARHDRIDDWDGSPRTIPTPGVVAHRDFDRHADGRWPLEQLFPALD